MTFSHPACGVAVSFKNPSTSPGGGGRPIRSKNARRINCCFVAGAFGAIFASSSFARMKRSMEVRHQSFVPKLELGNEGGAAFPSGSNDHHFLALAGRVRSVQDFPFNFA